jgi:ribosomal protein S7
MVFEDYVKLKYYNQVFYLLRQNLIGKFIKKGKKFYALKLYYKLKYLLKKKTKKDSNLLLLIAILNSLIKVNFIKVRFGGVKKEIPVFLKFERQIKFAINSLIEHAQTKQVRKLNLKKLVNLICFCYKFKGPIIKKNYQMYKKAIDNRVLLSFIKR